MAAGRGHRGAGLPGLAADDLPAGLASVAHLPRRVPALRVRPAKYPCRPAMQPSLTIRYMSSEGWVGVYHANPGQGLVIAQRHYVLMKGLLND